MKKNLTRLLMTCLMLGLNACTPILIGSAGVGVTAAHDRRTIATSLEDQNIELKAMNYMIQDQEVFKNTSISITSYNLHVLLTGQAKNQQLIQRYVSYIESIPRVARVINEIVVTPPIKISQTATDGYITSEIKLRLFKIKSEAFDPSRVKVITENSVVYLMGILSRDEAIKVVEIVRYIKGVRRVVKVFEYVD